MPSKPRARDWTRCGPSNLNDVRHVQLKRTYSSRDVAAMTGLSARQLQLWDASGLLPPAIRPHRTAAGGYTERRYTPIELFELLVLADLRRRGFSIRQLHGLVRILRDEFGERLFEATGGGGPGGSRREHVQLLTDGRDIYARTDAGAFYNLLKNPRQPMLVVGNEGALKTLIGRPRRRKKKRPGSKNPQGER